MFRYMDVARYVERYGLYVDFLFIHDLCDYLGVSRIVRTIRGAGSVSSIYREFLCRVLCGVVDM